MNQDLQRRYLPVDGRLPLLQQGPPLRRGPVKTCVDIHRPLSVEKTPVFSPRRRAYSPFFPSKGADQSRKLKFLHPQQETAGSAALENFDTYAEPLNQGNFVSPRGQGEFYKQQPLF